MYLVFEDDIVFGDGPLFVRVPNDHICVHAGAEGAFPGLQSSQPGRVSRHEPSDVMEGQTAPIGLRPEHRQVCRIRGKPGKAILLRHENTQGSGIPPCTDMRTFK